MGWDNIKESMETNFIAIGRIAGECIFIYKEDIDFLVRDRLTYKVKCIAIDFEEKRISRPVIIDVLLRFCPHEDVYSEGERSVINDLILYYFSDAEIDKFNRKFEGIRYSKNQTGTNSGYQFEEPPQND